VVGANRMWQCQGEGKHGTCIPCCVVSDWYVIYRMSASSPCVCVCVCVCRTSETEAQSDKAARLLGALRAGVEHLAEKVQPLKTVSKPALLSHMHTLHRTTV